MKKIILFTTISLMFCSFFLGICVIGTTGNAYAQKEWKEEYAEVCAKTQNAMTLSVAELKDYVARCDKLKERIDELNGMEGQSERKVYTKRLKMCRDLYEFTLEYKEK